MKGKATRTNVQFSAFGQRHKLTVNSLLDKKDEHFLYDKKMSTVLLCMEYSQAFSENKVDDDLQNRMYALFDEAFNGFDPFINGNEWKNEYSIIKTNIDKLKKTKAGECNLIMAYEIIGIQLTTLRSLISRSSIDGIFVEKEIKDIEINRFEQFYCDSQQNITGQSTRHKNVIPVYSTNGAIGFNTILFALFNDFLPIGLGAQPLLVHNGTIERQYINHLKHDYAHIFYVSEMKRLAPSIFEKYKKTYFQLFDLKKEKKIDDITFKKHLLILFYLAYDIAFFPEAHLHNTSSNVNDVEYRLRNDDLIFISDYVGPLNDLGYSLNSNPTRTDLGNAMIDLLNGFSSEFSDVPLQLIRSPEKPLAAKVNNAPEEKLQTNINNFEKKKKEIQRQFIKNLETLHRELNQCDKNNTTSQEERVRLYNALMSSQEQFFNALALQSTENKLKTAIIDFRKSYEENIENADKIMGHGWLYRTAEVVIKAIVGLLAGIGMVLGSLVGQGLAKSAHRQQFANTFFTLNQTDESQALDKFRQKILDEDVFGNAMKLPTH